MRSSRTCPTRSGSRPRRCGGRCRCSRSPGFLVALAIRYLPGQRRPLARRRVQALRAPRPPIELPGVLLAALATLGFGAVLGPEAPLILLGGGLGVLAVRLAARDAPPAAAVVGAAGSFAAISPLLGSPLLGAFLLLEASGLGGPMLGLVLLPGPAGRRASARSSSSASTR